MGVIERIGKPGDRNDYFQVKQEQWKEFLGHGFIDEMKMFRQMAEHGLALMANRDHPNRKLLETMYAVHSFLEREFPALVERWEREYQAKSE
jgi:DNA-binding transcriptional regulator GbsR (MarR family)